MSRRAELADKIANLTVNAKSPDGTVKVRLRNSEGLSVSLSERALNQPEDSLARQVGLAVTGLRQGYRRGYLQTINSLRRNPDPDLFAEKPDTGPVTPAKQRRARLESALDQVRVEAASVNRRVRVVMRLGDEVEVSIVPGSYANSPTAARHMEEEIRTALVNAHTELQRAKRKAVDTHEQTHRKETP